MKDPFRFLDSLFVWVLPILVLAFLIPLSTAAQIIRPTPTPILIKATPTPIVIKPTPTKAILLPTPTATPKLVIPTPTLIPMNPFDLQISQVVLDTTSVVHSIPGQDQIQGTFVLTPTNTSVTSFTLRIEYTLLDSDQNQVKEWTETRKDVSLHTLGLKSNRLSFSLPITPGDALFLKSHFIRITARVVNDTTKELVNELNLTNNTADSNVNFILHTSGLVLFDTIQTELNQLRMYTPSPLMISGEATLNETTPLLFDQIMVQRNANLDLVVIDGNVPFSLPNPHQPTAGPWSYTHDAAALTPEGAFAFLRINLPPGISYRFTNMNSILFTESPLPIMVQELDQNLNLAAPEIHFPVQTIWCSEGLPFEIETQGFLFRPDREFTFLQPKINYRFAFPAALPAANAPRPSNDGYFQSPITVQGDITLSTAGLQARLKFSAGQYQPSFPRPFEITHNGGEVVIRDGRILSAESALQDIAIRGAVQNSGCAEGSALHIAEIPGSARIAPDGSVVAAGALKTPFQPAFNTYEFSPVRDAAWYQPGFHLPNTPAAGNGNHVAAYLQSMRERESESQASTGTTAFTEGQGLFAGINLMPEALQALSFTAGIGGDHAEFQSTIHSKFYIRQAGYSGVVHAQSETTSLELYPDPTCENRGYETKLTSFGQAYLDNQSDGLDSVNKGIVNLPWPAAFDVPFEEMALNACGDLTEGRIPSDAQAEERILSYWNAPFRLLTLAFLDRTENAPPGNKTLWLTTMNKIPHYDDSVFMQVNLCPTGNIRESYSDHPAQSGYDGYKVAVEQIYFSYYDGNPSLPNGFYNLIGDLVVSFFDPPKIHALVRGSVGRIADGSPWEENRTPDTVRRGFPDHFQTQNSDIASLIETYVDQNPIHVQKLFANLITLDYELVYQPTRRVFQSKSPLQQDLVVIDIESAVENLNNRLAEISFGVEAGGLPELNLSSMGDAFTAEITQTFLGPIRDQLDEAAHTLTGDITTAIRGPMKDFIQPRVAVFLNTLQPHLAQLDAGQAEAFINSVTFTDLLDDLMTQIHLPSYMQLNTNPVADTVQDLIDRLNAVNAALHFKPSSLADDLGPLVQALIDLAFIYAQISTGIYVQDIIAPIEQPLQEMIQFLDTEVLPRIEEAQHLFSLEGANSFLLTHFPGAQIAQVEAEIKAMLREILRQWAQSNVAQLQNIQAEEVTDYILTKLLNSTMVREFNTVLTETLFPIKDALLDQAQGVLDLINDEIETFIKEKTDFADGAYSQIKNALGFEGASMKGYAIISGNRMDKLHIDGEFTMKSPEEITYAAYLDMTRYQASNSGSNCAASLDEGEYMDVRIGAKDIGLDWAGADLTADLIELKLMISGGQLVNVGGALNTSGTLGFESFAIEGPDFGLAIGAVENYIYAGCSVFFESYRLSGGIFLGRSCTLEPLQVIDPRAAERLSITSMTGIYLGVEGSFPILDYGCALRVGAEASLAMWYFTEGPTFGGRLEAGVYGRVACVVSAKGKLELNAGKNNGKYYFDGRAWVAGGIGWCEPSKWSTPQKALKDSWCFACVAIFELFFDDGWSADYETDCG